MSRTTSRTSTLVAAALTGIGYAVTAALCLLLTRQTNGVAAIWPASGIGLAALVLTRRTEWPWMLGAVALGSFAANWGTGTSLALSIGFTVFNLAEMVIAATVATAGRTGHSDPFRDIASISRFAVGAAAGGLASAVGATLVGGGDALFLLSWLFTVILGMLIVAPVIVTANQHLGEARHGQQPFQFIRLVAVVAATGAVSAAVFFRQPYPLLFVPMAVVVFATYGLGPLGAGVSVLVIGLIGSYCTSLGIGPAAIGVTEFGRMLFFQTYIVTLLASSMPLATLLAVSRRTLRDLQSSHRLLKAAERAARVGHWRLNVASEELFWSAEVYNIYGLEAEASPRLDQALAAFHPDDRERVTAQVEDAIEKQEGYQMEARLIRPDGEVRHVHCRGMIECKNGEVEALFGIFMDVTDRVMAIQALTQEREQAVAEAAAAKRLAETDQLTGLANRRKVLSMLNTDIVGACTGGQNLSIVMLDVDHFKRINDRYGHAMGDEVLRAIAALAQSCVRDGDLVGRLGGEEFLIVLPWATPEGAEAIAERVRLQIAGAVWPPGGPDQVTVSLGVASYSCGMKANDMLQAADVALYEAKNAGRNRLRVAA